MADIQKEIPSAGVQILDATQNAVIGAVNSVSEMIEKTTVESTFTESAPHEAFYLEAEFWVGFSFILVVVCLFKPLFGVLKSLLVKRRDRIVSDLEEALKLRDDAQALYARYERQYADVDKEVEKITNEANADIQAFLKDQTQELDREFFKRKKEADAIILSSQEKAQRQMDIQVSEKTLLLVRQYLEDHIDAQKKSEMIDESIKNIINSL